MPAFNASDPLLEEKIKKFLKEHKLFSKNLQMKVPKEIMEITTSNHSKRVLDYARVYVVDSPHLLAIASNDTASLCKVELDALTLVMNTLIDIRDSMQSNYLVCFSPFRSDSRLMQKLYLKILICLQEDA